MVFLGFIMVRRNKMRFKSDRQRRAVMAKLNPGSSSKSSSYLRHNGSIKDWKKIVDDKGYIKFYNSKSEKILLVELKERDGAMRYKNPLWFISVGGSLRRESIKEFVKTKSQALRFAKNYMRKH